MIPNMYYLRNLPFTFSNTLVAYLFPNMMSIGIVATRGSQSVQVFVMTPLVIAPIGGFSSKNLVPYFQSPTWNPPTGFDNSRGGIPMESSGSPLHGSGWPPKGGSGPLGRGVGPPSKGGPLNGGGSPSGGGPLGGGEGGFLVGGASVPFGVPWPCSPWNPWYPPWYPP
jgi:hypothetical protein